MHLSTALAAVAAVVPLANAHGSGLPTILGLNPKDLKARAILSNLGAQFAEVHDFARTEAKSLNARQNDRECGEGIGNCGAGLCCSQSGFCGTDGDFCYSPGCDYKHGPSCPENQTPGGSDTSSIARTKVGNVAYGGAGIYNCVQPGTVALTYDDGPAKTLTSHILDLMKQYNAKATFFITGNNINKGQIDITPEFVDVIKRMDSEGHQLASHTWTHLDLSVISQEDRKAQMIKNEMALRNIVGKIPTYMRPPFSSCTGQCETDMADLGYHVIYFDVDTDDYNQDSPNQIQRSKDWFLGNITKEGATAAGGAKWLDIQHDIHEQTANNLTEFMLKTITDLGYRGVTVGECLGDDKANWYRTADGAGAAPTTTTGSNPPASTGTKQVTTDATCGGNTGFTFGNCCSVSGWCGTSADYCGSGCQTDFGNCGSNDAATSAAPAPAPSPSTASGGKVSTDGSCAGTSGFTCSGSSFGNCCSQYGWCGSSTDHCDASCNAAFGTCSGGDGGDQAEDPQAGNGAEPGSSKCPGSFWGQWLHMLGWC
ncbi:hypothetical protein DE146DRAFT_781783 [Phaeosphaeria sp. MPI-PUGE-AT-0046c]|nr:hypothetical protein DE146DRAFT_781783 [Phaeosphaeria sp. MPI-PUGE-AT-0046c]